MQNPKLYFIVYNFVAFDWSTEICPARYRGPENLSLLLTQITFDTIEWAFHA